MNKKLSKGLIVFIGYLLIPMIVNSFLPSINESNTTNLIIRVLIYLGIIAGCIFIYKDDLKREWKIVKKSKIKFILSVIVFLVLLIFLMAIGSTIVANISNIKSNSNDSLINNYYKTIPIYMFFETLIYAPFVEEMVFRKVFYDIIPSKLFCIIFSALVFGFYHLGYTMSSVEDLISAIPYVLTGVVLISSYVKTKSIYAPVIIHFTYNLLVLLIQFVG